jgi:hypothetical protein
VSDPKVSDKEARAAANWMVLHPACHDDPVEFLQPAWILAGQSPKEVGMRNQEKAGESGSVHCGLGKKLSARYCMCWPPLIAILAPVTNAASSEHR